MNHNITIRQDRRKTRPAEFIAHEELMLREILRLLTLNNFCFSYMLRLSLIKIGTTLYMDNVTSVEKVVWNRFKEDTGYEEAHDFDREVTINGTTASIIFNKFRPNLSRRDFITVYVNQNPVPLHMGFLLLNGHDRVEHLNKILLDLGGQRMPKPMLNDWSENGEEEERKSKKARCVQVQTTYKPFLTTSQEEDIIGLIEFYLRDLNIPIDDPMIDDDAMNDNPKPSHFIPTMSAHDSSGTITIQNQIFNSDQFFYFTEK